MAANYLHGVETIEIDKGPRAVRLVKTAVIGLIGTAVTGPVNELTLISSDRQFAQWGPDVPGATIPDALDAIYKQRARCASCSMCSILLCTRRRWSMSCCPWARMA